MMYAIMFLAGSETYVNQTSELVHVFVGGEEIITTPTHPFYSPVKAGRMRPSFVRATFWFSSMVSMSSLKKSSMRSWKAPSVYITSRSPVTIPTMCLILACWCIMGVEIFRQRLLNKRVFGLTVNVKLEVLQGQKWATIP